MYEHKFSAEAKLPGIRLALGEGVNCVLVPAHLDIDKRHSPSLVERRGPPADFKTTEIPGPRLVEGFCETNSVAGAVHG